MITIQAQMPPAPAKAPTCHFAAARELHARITELLNYIDMHGTAVRNDLSGSYFLSQKRLNAIAQIKAFLSPMLSLGWQPKPKQLATLKESVEALVPNSLQSPHIGNLVGYQTQINLYIKQNYLSNGY